MTNPLVFDNIALPVAICQYSFGFFDVIFRLIYVAGTRCRIPYFALFPDTQEQNRCFPMTVMSGRDQIHELVAVDGLK